MRLSHSRSAVGAVFDDPNLVSCAGLVPVMRLAADCGLDERVRAGVRLGGEVGANAAGKVTAIVAGMIAGADSIDDLDVLRHGGMGRLFEQVYAPSTLGSFLRAFTFGHVRQLESAGRQVLVEMAAQAPLLLHGSDHVTFVDVDSLLRRVYGKAKQGAGFGHTKVGGYDVRLRGLNPLVATLSTRDAAPVVAATRLRAGNAASARGAASLIAEAVGVARAAGASGRIMVRADSAFYNRKVISACRRAGVCFSITARNDTAISKAIAAIDDEQWTSIKYPRAVWDDDEQRWISDAQIAETTYTAFAGTKDQHTARLIVRRVKRLNPQAAHGQDELFPQWRYHAVFTDSPFILAQAESDHRGHAVIEQVFADLIDGPLAHLPSGRFNANAAWLSMAAIAHNLTRAAGCLTSLRHARARTATIRRQLINIAARITRSARKITLRLPQQWPWQTAFTTLWINTHPPG